ncbi:heavy metal-associated domain-containing protein [Salegentibacter sp. F188]|jgi:copper chaperone CopZ|uniref:Heavy metal-associated domain-containing protein n=1 Tax=Autumnicola patrickiae TaxID=3075591 RepID=A0ABU3E7W7_9FLAO|nr:heavy metal-associated domain-containing protein [Salegentibacter sp. F188]MDT0691347.1 heavy metal-associated domain-containing protein [Salegentibacter sp. F188]
MKRIALIIVVAVFGTISSNAQITKVDQEVFGMDCAPCAYGLERGLKKMDGIEKVRVSLNDGKAYLDLTANNNLSLKQIQEEVKVNGFSAKNAEVVLEGQLIKEDNALKIKVKNEEYYLTSNTGQSVINSLQPGTVKVRGIVQDEEDGSLTDKWKIKITEIL